MPVVTDFLFDDRNLDEMAAHGVSDRRALEVLEEGHIILPNRKGRTGLFLLIGRDRGGAFLTLPIQPTMEEGVWRPVTAWPSKEHEKAQFEKRWSKHHEQR